MYFFRKIFTFLFLKSNCLTASSSLISTDMETNIETLITMGFTNRDLNRQALTKTGNDISEAVTLLTSSNDDVIISNPCRTISTFIGPLTKDEQKQIVRRKINDN